MSLLLFPPFLCLLLLCIGPASVLSADDAILRRLSIQNRWLRRRDHIWFGGSAHKELGQQSCDDREPDQYFAQKLDHTNANGTDTYDQRYQANLRHHNSSSPWPIVFLMIGGEGQIHDKWVCDQRVTIMQLAARHGAIVVQLEHRFFGRNDSSGLGDLSAENLQRLLSLDQALDDIAAFVPFFNARYGLLNARWVAFGGSYPGSMAAWLRVKYPDLTAGSVASSAPIWPKVDFWEYSATMENAIKETSAQCLAKVKSAFSELASRIHDDQGKESLTMLYSAKPELKDLSPIDLTNFLSAVFGTWQGIIQYTFDEPYHVLDNVTRACELLDEAADLQQGLYNVFWMVKWQQCQRAGIPEEECRVNDFRYSKAIEPFLNTSLESDEAAGRAWMWMTCNEFGWYQTTDKENSIFGDIISLNFYYQQCADIFGSQIGARFVESRVEKSLTKWGDGCTFEASNIILPNGRFDPWSALGIRGICRGPEKQKADLARYLVAAWTPAAAHCADMYPAYEGEPAGLELTRQKVAAEVKYYLDSALDRLQNGATGRVGGGMAIVMLLVSFLSLFNFMAILL